MRGLKHLIPDDVKDSLNSSPWFQWFVTGFMVVVGVLLVVKGINGFKNKQITGNYGRVYEGATAQMLSLLWIAIGGLAAVMPLFIQLIRMAS